MSIEEMHAAVRDLPERGRWDQYQTLEELAIGMSNESSISIREDQDVTSEQSGEPAWVLRYIYFVNA